MGYSKSCKIKGTNGGKRRQTTQKYGRGWAGTEAKGCKMRKRKRYRGRGRGEEEVEEWSMNLVMSPMWTNFSLRGSAP